MTKDSRVYCSQGPEQLPAKERGSLSGTQFVFKDLFDVKGFKTGAGNPQWLATHPCVPTTSSLISKLLNNGAECVGRVQTDELAYSLNGQNIHYGTPVNPVAPDCIPGGSSSGSAVTVANGECDFSIGTDTGGSVRVPASYCGLFGLRPTLGSLDLHACFELSKSFDTAGIFSRELPLLRKVWRVLSGSKSESHSATHLYLDNQCAQVLSEERLARLKHWCKQADIELICGDLLHENGWQLSDLSLLFRTIQGFEIIQKHGLWLEQHGESLDPTILERVKWSRTISEQDYLQAMDKQAKFKELITYHLTEYALVWAIPTTPSGPPALTMSGEALATYRMQLMGLTSIAGLSGLPQLHLPMRGLQEGPCGISVMGLTNREEDLITTGEALIQGEKFVQGDSK
ncbi:amidase [Vibrio diazotrophicus]|uniref:Amidase n=1 Tax=Vibrio diazotrophicus TaxID=685 RepID=A0ABX4WDQ2_VIBDI|nr:amidase [Vibrio diazotrophicus]PNI02175.1 amidase [Vibrio diazotrophicus]